MANDDNFWVFKDGPKTTYKLKDKQDKPLNFYISDWPTYNYGYSWNDRISGQLLWSGTITVPTPKFHAQILNFGCSTREEAEAHNLKLALDSVDPNVEGDW